MMFILRWLVILILLVFIAANLFPALIASAVQTDVVDVGQYSQLLQQLGASSVWYEIALWYGSAVLLFIAMIRLIRKTQAFWAWLLGFACYGAHWALAEQREGGVMTTLQSISLDSINPANIGPESPVPALGLIVLLLIIGILIWMIDHGDRAYWNRQLA